MSNITSKGKGEARCCETDRKAFRESMKLFFWMNLYRRIIWYGK